jgi:hypothetical protein
VVDLGEIRMTEGYKELETAIIPLDDTTNEDQRVKDVAGVVHTPAVKAARQAFLASQGEV